ncbi:MAG: hypothetical protein JWQ38_2089 [Flavipsychrobacter sp.]|nr:hypothetical protein [Flavipsychrobacter sp.]
MKKLFLPLLAIAFVFLGGGCSTKFDVAAPYKNITVVYGLLDQKDTAHYIRIQKAFLDQNKSAVTMAKEADSNFFSNISVRIDRYSFDQTFKDSIHLYRVDLNNEGYPKEAGAFFTSPNYAYKFTNPLDPNYIYRIRVTHLSTGEVDSAEAPIIDDKPVPFGFRPPLYVYVLDDSSGNRAGLDFANTGSYSFVEIQGNYQAVENFTFQGIGSPVTFVQAVVRFHWIDSNIVTHSRVPQYYDYDAGYYNLQGNGFDYKIKDLSLYSALAAGMATAPADVQRYMDRAEIFVFAGTHDFANYLAANQTQGTGLTGSEIEPIYTNIKGENTLGLFTSRATHSGFLTITNNTIDSLIASPIMSRAKIKGVSYH